jgi:DNA-binding response OmpR family regulator
MIFRLTDAELIAAMQSMVRTADGSLAIELPANRLEKCAAMAQPTLTFCESTRTVSCNGAKTRLSPIQFALLRRVSENGRVGYETLQDSVWGVLASDNTIRAAVAKVNSRLLDGGFPVELVAHRSRVSLELVG